MDVSDIIDGIKETTVDDGGANYIQMNQGISTIATVVSTILGYMMVILVVGVSIVVALEVLYLNIPPLNSALERLTEKSKSSNKILGLILRDARRAIYNADAIRTGNSVNVEYLKIKWKIILLGFIIAGITLNSEAFIAFINRLISNII